MPMVSCSSALTFLENLDLLSAEEVRQIELGTIGQFNNEQRHLCRKGFVRTSKAHEAITKSYKARKGGGSTVNIWSLKEKFYGITLSIQTS